MKKERYIKDVLRSLSVNPTIKKRIVEDLTERIERGIEEDPYFNVLEAIGDPREVAKEFMDNLDINDEAFIQIGVGFQSTPFEYKSKATLLGLPLIHINTGGRYNNKVAKGLIAVGDVALGVISVGGVSLGVVSLGGIGLGVIGIGGIGIGVLGIGGVGLGLHAIGGVAMGLYEAFGAFKQIFFS